MRTSRRLPGKQTAVPRGGIRPIAFLTICALFCVPGFSGCLETKAPQSDQLTQKSDESADQNSGREAAKTGHDKSDLTQQVGIEKTDRGVDSHEDRRIVQQKSVGKNSDEKSSTEPNASEADSVSGGASNPAGGKSKPVADSKATLKSVAELRGQARAAKGKQDYGTAFRLETEAFEKARLHPNDPQLKQQSLELTNDLDKLGDLLNEKFSGEISKLSRPLIEK